MKTLIAVLCAALCSTLFAARAEAAASICNAIAGNLVANCGFETGDFTGWTLSGNDVPGELNNLYGVEGTDPFPLPDGTAPNSGNSQAFVSDLVANPTTLSQSLTTVAGDKYAVSFYLAQQLVGPGTANNALTLQFGTSTLANLTDVGVQGYTLYTYTATATAASSVLSLNLGNDIGEFLVDDLSVTQQAPVPVPASAWLLLSGLGLGSLFSRRRGRNRETAGRQR